MSADAQVALPFTAKLKIVIGSGVSADISPFSSGDGFTPNAVSPSAFQREEDEGPLPPMTPASIAIATARKPVRTAEGL